MNKLLIITALFIFIFNCASSPRYHTGGAVRSEKKTTLPVSSPSRRIALDEVDQSNVPLMTIQKSKSAVLTSSYYGDDFHGRKTASGEIFNMYEKTAAHKELPLGTILNVTYLKTGKSVIVKVNDRGPYIEGRDLDLSYGAAKKIGLVAEGVGKVKVTVIQWGE
ncbi:MAG: septal ring lytic transglycosylase RlpA family protein [Candidatus Marinimicrobia bacterium]|nr:septal ring lytic transglycosylase RlpA family protein [Candidatus Neomarinimicrobiota bacterium]